MHKRTREATTALARLLLILTALLVGRSAQAAGLAPPPPALDATSPDQDPARPSDGGRLSVILENDALAPALDDFWYTQGVVFSYLSRPLDHARLQWLFPASPDASRTQRFEILGGQSLFTPEETKLVPPDPADRPYAGWLYGGVGLFQETGRRRLDHVELVAGVVGPSAFGENVQRWYHGLIHQTSPLGWSYQLGNEPGIVLSYERRQRFEKPVGAGVSVDVIPEAGASVGNIFDYGEMGAMVRLGRGLGADYGPERIRPASSGAAWFDADQMPHAVGWYVFAGTEGRAFARNIFLDGSTFESSPSVDKRIFVGDLSVGGSAFWRDFVRLDFVLTYRSREFSAQPTSSQFGGVNLSFRFFP